MLEGDLMKNNSMTKYFHKTGEMNGSSYVKVLLRSFDSLNIESDDKYRFLWSILARFHHIPDQKNGHSTRVSKYRRYFSELNI